MSKPPAKKQVAARLQAEGYKVFPVALAGIDMFALKDGRASLVAVDDGQEPSPVLSMLRGAGLDVKLEGRPANQRHGAHRVTKSISVKADDQLCLDKLEHMLHGEGRTLSQWFVERMYEFVTRRV